MKKFLFLILTSVAVLGQEFDFTRPDALKEWTAVHDVAPLEQSAEGMLIKITGADPYLHGPARDYPAGQPLWLNLRIKSTRGGNAQIFYFDQHTTEENSVRFYVPGGDWADLRIPFPALGPKMRLRIDPPGTSGSAVIAKLRFEPRPIPVAPQWPQPTPPVFDRSAVLVTSGDLTLKHAPALGAFELSVGGKSVAIGNNRPLLGYSNRWIEVTNKAHLAKRGRSIVVGTSLRDPDGGEWQFTQIFSAARPAGAFDVETWVSVNKDRSITSLPLLTLLPGVGSFGTNKTQGVFAGLEFLENEPSSSEADVIGPGARRQVPDGLKIAFPLMAIAAKDAWVGLIWDQEKKFSALFDSPDRIFNSGGHAMGLMFPGSEPSQREDGSLLPYGGALLRANEKLVLRATILGGNGATTIPAVQEYVRRRGLPKMPDPGYTAKEFFELEARGWLDSEIRDGSKFRHAVGNGFGSAAVGDAPFYMDWLATQVPDARLSDTARAALAQVAPAHYNSAAVGHIRHPAEALVFGAVPENVTQALAEGRGRLGAFPVKYTAPEKGLDLGKTHWSREANGLTATHVSYVLDRAAFTGDRKLIDEGLRLLRTLDQYRDTVPRGAQTWEVPVHTPDILGSAYLVRAYLLGYELSGERDFLDHAKYWAWTGVPFVYLTQATTGKVGVYSTTPVFGATQFVAPLWIGLPVQWCGLVYGDAIRRLARFDSKGPWLTLANGIAAAGIQHVHTAEEPNFQGLLPDSFDLRAQLRNPVPINPATLLPEAIQFYGFPATYDMRTFSNRRIIAHCPGPITDVSERGDRIRFRAHGWPKKVWYLLVNGFEGRPVVKVDGREMEFEFKDGYAIVPLSGQPLVEITLNRAKPSDRGPDDPK